MGRAFLKLNVLKELTGSNASYSTKAYNTARAVTELRQDEVARRRMEELGAKASAGRLSPEEEREYDVLIEVSDVIATLQLKARQQVAGAI